MMESIGSKDKNNADIEKKRSTLKQIVLDFGILDFGNIGKDKLLNDDNIILKF